MPLQLEIMTKLRERTVAQLTAILSRGSTDSKDTPPKTPQTTEETLVKHDETLVPGDSQDDAVTDEDPIEKLAKAIEIEMMKLCGVPLSLFLTQECIIWLVRRREWRVQEQVPYALL